MKIIFMSTSDFGVASLTQLLQNDKIEIVAVYTKPPKPAGRGHKIANSIIHKMALENNLKVLTPSSFKDEEAVKEFQSFNADFALVVSYGLILPQKIIESTKFASINIHPSILPKWRGATPIQSTLLNGDEKIGVSIIKMDAGIDSGDIISQNEFFIEKTDNFANLSPKLAEIGAKMAINAIFDIYENKAKFAKQDEKLASYSKKFAKNDAKIDFNEDANVVLNKIRALSGYLTAFFEYKNEQIKIFEAKIVDFADDEKYKIGEIVNDKFVIKCKKDAIQPLILQRAGRKIMKIEDFLLGFNKS